MQFQYGLFLNAKINNASGKLFYKCMYEPKVNLTFIISRGTRNYYTQTNPNFNGSSDIFCDVSIVASAFSKLTFLREILTTQLSRRTIKGI